MPATLSTTPTNQRQELLSYVESLYGDIKVSECPFTETEISELLETNEL